MAKRIGFFIDTNVIGGAEVLLLKLAKQVKDCGWVPVVLHFGSANLVKLMEGTGISHYVVPLKLKRVL